MIVKPVAAQSMPKPSVPEFTLKFHTTSQYQAPTYQTDPFTGKNVTLTGGYYVEGKAVDIKIRNQPFTSRLDATGNYTHLYYIYRVKGHFTNETDWNYGINIDSKYYNASNSEYTTITRVLVGYPFSGEVLAGSQIDFQIQALTGHIDVTQQLIYFGGFGTINNYSFVGVSGDWSPTQTITIGETSASTSPNPTLLATPTPSVPEFPATLALTFLALTALTIAVASRRKHLAGS